MLQRNNHDDHDDMFGAATWGDDLPPPHTHTHSHTPSDADSDTEEYQTEVVFMGFSVIYQLIHAVFPLFKISFY